MSATFSKLIDYYNRLYKDKGENSMRLFNEYERFIRYLIPIKGTRLLDVASGTGYLMKVAEALGLKSYDIDISIEACITSSVVKTGVINANGEYIPFKASIFDYTTCIGSLEHFLNIENGIKELLRVGKANARYCIVLPNSEYKYTGTNQIEEKLLSLSEWQAFLRTSGLQVDNIYKDNYLGRRINIFQDWNLLRVLHRLIEKCWLYLIPVHKAYQFIFI